ncbi:MAG: MFS transporter [Caldilineaceae bacterium]|nr:MFS transporter [Caldilineaceae bacterium]
MESNVRAQRTELPFVQLMGISISARLITDTVAQLFNPFLTIFALGLGVDVVTMGRLLSLRLLAGIFTPVFGALADRHGYRRMLRLGLLSMVVGLLLVSSNQGLVILVLGMFALGLGQAGFVPTLQAYLSVRLPYAIRARGLGILEYSWALAGMVGLFVIGQWIAAAGWQLPLLGLAGGLAGAWLLFAFLPPAHINHTPTTPVSSTTRGQQWRAFFSFGTQARTAYSAIVANALLFYAGMHLMVIYGAWLSAEYRLGAADLGWVALLLGCSDLIASVSVSLFTDRLGKRRSVIMGTIGMLLGYLLLPFLNFGLTFVVAGLAFTRGAFEFGVVSQISLLSEQVPEQRGKLMSLSSAVVMVGGAIANLTGPWLYIHHGISGIVLVSAIALVSSIGLLLALVREPMSTPQLI